MSGTRFIINEKSTRTPVTVLNRKKTDISMQVWLDKYPESYFTTNKSFQETNGFNKGLTLSPNFFKVKSKNDFSFYINKISSISLPKDKESILGLYLRSLPEQAELNGSAIFLAQQVLLKVIYRPKNLEKGRERAEENVYAKCDNNQLILVNPTPYIFSISTIYNNKKTIDYSKLLTNGINKFKDLNCYDDLNIGFIDDFGSEKKYKINYK
ncbi:TPA: fimbria/pilus periplasmic chaperone [Photobacterium damselae]